MAKKKRINRKVAKKTAVRRPRAQKIIMIPSKGANICVILAMALLVLNGILSITMSDWITSQAQTLNIALSKSTLITLGINWLILFVIVYIINNKIRKNITEHQIMDRSWMWFLLIVSIVTVFLGRLDAGILLLVASVIYLVKSKK